MHRKKVPAANDQQGSVQILDIMYFSGLVEKIFNVCFVSRSVALLGSRPLKRLIVSLWRKIYRAKF